MDPREYSKKLLENMKRAIKGKDEQLAAVTAALFAGGNILLDDVPGTGKTTLAKALARSMDCEFKRIQFTPDLLPSDVTGIHFFNMKEQRFELRKGPVFANIVLADEINRASPRTQSALLECMEERQTTIDGEELKMPLPFIVIATQNPVETAGTFRLPEAQLDRFLIRLSLGYPQRESESEILDGGADPAAALTPVVSANELSEIQAFTSQIKVNGSVRDYILDLGENTRNNPEIALGVSTRGLIALKKFSQGLAAVKGKDFVSPDEVQTAARYVLPHRLICRRTSRENASIVEEMISRVPAPTEEIKE